MIPLILQSLPWSVPAVFFYTSTKMLLAALTALLLTILFGPWTITKLYELKIGQHIRVDECPMLGKLHERKQDTPTMGGLLMLAALLASLLLWMDLTSETTWWLCGSTVWLAGIGAIDDAKKLRSKSARGLSGKWKLTMQSVLAISIALWLFSGGATPYYIPFYKEPLFTAGIVFAVPFTICVIAGSSNSVNLTDGLDGLAAGCVVMVAAVLGMFAFLQSHADLAAYLNLPINESADQVAIYLAGIGGAALGFLWYNGHPAQVFMGDTGSLFLGGMLGICAVMLRRELLLALVGGLFVAEACSVMLQVAVFRMRGGRRLFRCAPLHHHFEYKGWSETKVVVRFWIISLLLALLGLISIKFQ